MRCTGRKDLFPRHTNGKSEMNLTPKYNNNLPDRGRVYHSLPHEFARAGHLCAAFHERLRESQARDGAPAIGEPTKSA